MFYSSKTEDHIKRDNTTDSIQKPVLAPSIPSIHSSAT